MVKRDHMWHKPMRGVVKINVDASFSAENLAASTGAVARDEHGDFIAAASWFIPHVVSVDAAEMIAIRNGFYLAGKIGCNILHIESDSSNAVSAVNSENLLRQEATILLESREMGLDYAKYEVSNCPGEANYVADCIAKSSLASRTSDFWEGAIPDFISQHVVNDLAIM